MNRVRPFSQSMKATILITIVTVCMTVCAADKTATDKNLQASFAGESQAYQKYTAFAQKADADGLPQIAKLFRAAAQAEALHAAKQLKLMGTIKTTAENLQAAIDGESYEYTKMYPEFAAQATKDKNDNASMIFGGTGAVEKGHAGLYTQALATAKTGKDLTVQPIFFCTVCGNIMVGTAPETCPVCTAPKSSFTEVK
ncbi:MAG: rubrerythrin family protein [Chitinivibrionales bacterium]|nr:rubrerythrin family protein [Chitinivibrionales bacterium]